MGSKSDMVVTALCSICHERKELSAARLRAAADYLERGEG